MEGRLFIMCGIVGYVGKRQASNLLVEGLSKLEYRGYDSAGVAILNEGINVRKFKGRLNNLALSLKEKPVNGHIGIGHTRWATHGEPSDVNSHPHTTENATISVVHNGIIVIKIFKIILFNCFIFVKNENITINSLVSFKISSISIIKSY